MITHFWYRFGRTNSLEDVKVFLMSLWVLIRKDEERMSYAENYFFFNSMSKRKIRLGEIICKAEKSKVKKFILSSFSWKCDKSMVFNECWCYYLPRGLRWLWKQPFILVGNPASVPSRFFYSFFSRKDQTIIIFLNTNLVSQGVRFDFSSSRRIFQPWELIWSITAGRFFLLKTLFSLAGSFFEKKLLFNRVDFGNASSSSFVWILIFRLKFL